MQPNLRSFDRLIRFLLAAYAFFAAAVLFQHPLARVLVAAFGLLSLGECVLGHCWLAARLGVTRVGESFKKEALYLFALAGIQTALAYQWWSAGWEKVSNPDFVGKMGDTLAFFASKNPFPWYKEFLTGFASQNATVFAYAVELSQVAIAVTLAVSAWTLVYSRSAGLKRTAVVVAVLALAGGMLMNANFYLAAGWTGPGTKGSNVVMFWSQAMLAYVWITALLSKERV